MYIVYAVETREAAQPHSRAGSDSLESVVVVIRFGWCLTSASSSLTRSSCFVSVQMRDTVSGVCTKSNELNICTIQEWYVSSLNI